MIVAFESRIIDTCDLCDRRRLERPVANERRRLVCAIPDGPAMPFQPVIRNVVVVQLGGIFKLAGNGKFVRVVKLGVKQLSFWRVVKRLV